MIEDMAQYRFRPGQSGNPAGRVASPHLRKLRKLLRAKTPKAMKALDDCLEHRSHKVRLEALKLWFLYSYGKPQEFAPGPGASEFVHQIDARQFTEAELVEMEERVKALTNAKEVPRLPDATKNGTAKGHQAGPFGSNDKR